MAPQILRPCKIKKFKLQSKLKLTAYFWLDWDTLWQEDLWESCSYTYLVCQYLSRTISLDYVCIINELTMCPQLWSYLLMNNANSLQGVSWSYSIVTLMHQIENCCEISTQRCCTQLPCVLQFLDFFLLLSNLGHVSYDLGWVRHRLGASSTFRGRSQIMSKQMGILIQQSDLQLLFTKNVKLHIELCTCIFGAASMDPIFV